MTPDPHPPPRSPYSGMRRWIAAFVGLAAGLTFATGALAAAVEPPPLSSAAPAPLAPPPQSVASSASGAGLASPARPDCPRPFSLGLHDHGVLYSSQTGEGIDKDIAEEMARRSGCRISLTVLPRSRIWQLIESGALDFSLSAIADRQRDQFATFAWYVSNKYYLLVRRDSDVHTVEDFRGRPNLKVGLIRGFRYGDSANSLVTELDEAQRVKYATSHEPLYAILLEGDIQAMIIEPFDFPVIASAQLHGQTSILEFDDPPVLHGLVMSRKSLSAAQQAAWRDVITGMRSDGTIRRIFEKYFPAELARTMTQF
jgi:polar amino acid transport system substrate-binding protein